MLRDGGVVGAEQLLNLDARQAAIPAPLSQPRRGLKAQQSDESDWQVAKKLTEKCSNYTRINRLEESTMTSISIMIYRIKL